MKAPRTPGPPRWQHSAPAPTLQTASRTGIEASRRTALLLGAAAMLGADSRAAWAGYGPAGGAIRSNLPLTEFGVEDWLELTPRKLKQRAESVSCVQCLSLRSANPLLRVMRVALCGCGCDSEAAGAAEGAHVPRAIMRRRRSALIASPPLPLLAIHGEMPCRIARHLRRLRRLRRSVRCDGGCVCGVCGVRCVGRLRAGLTARASS